MNSNADVILIDVRLKPCELLLCESFWRALSVAVVMKKTHYKVTNCAYTAVTLHASDMIRVSMFPGPENFLH